MTIEAVGVSLRKNGKILMPEVSITCLPGTTLAIVGPSGSGKTTLLNCLGLLQRVTDGSIHVDGEDATRWNDGKRRTFWRDKAVFIFQDYGLIEDETVAYNVTMSDPSAFSRKRKMDPRVAKTLSTVGLEGRGGDLVSGLSGGEKQRVGLARAVHKQAKYIFADEPTASLDEENRLMVADLLQSEARRGASVIIATHDDALMEACDTQLNIGRTVVA